MSRTPFEDRLIEIIQNDAPPPPLTRWRNRETLSTHSRWRYRFAPLGAAAAALGVLGVTALAFVGTANSHKPPVATHGVGPTSISSPGTPTATGSPAATPQPSSTTTPHGVVPPPPAPVPTHSTAPAPAVWSPPVGVEWQIENDHPLDTNNAVDMGTSTGSGPVTTYTGADAPAPAVYEIDGFDNPATTVAALHSKGAHVVCYIDVGAWENWRSDASNFPSSVLGSSAGSGERWLDIRQLSVLEPLMTSRLQMCKSKGFDAVDPDNVDGYENSTGFPLTAQDQLTYNTWIAQESHAVGLGVALHNDNDQVAQLAPAF